MKIIGYSERGIVSSLFYEIAYSKTPSDLLCRLLAMATFPFTEFTTIGIPEAEILIEQSFSDFGDLDTLLLISQETHKYSIFIEAKVKPSQTPAWKIEEEWGKFQEGIQSTLSSSNLFTQLYHKVRLVETLRSGGIAKLQKGIPFPRCSSKLIRKIGKNEVVLRAVKKLQGYLDASYYVALVPDSPEAVGRFFQDKLICSMPHDFIGWDVQSYGYLTWADVEKFCIDYRLENSLEVFSHNKGQIS